MLNRCVWTASLVVLGVALYDLAKCIVQSIRDNELGIAKEIVDDFHGFDPAHPDALDAFGL